MVGSTIALSTLPANAQESADGTPVRTVSVSTATAPVAFPPIPERTEAFCAPLQTNKHGLLLDASGSAFQYAKDQPGRVGISVAKGRDLDMPAENFGTILVNTFRGAGIEAECYIDPDGAANGSAITLNVNGISWKEDGFMNLDEATDRNELRGVVAEAKTGGVALTQVSMLDSNLN